MPTAVQTTAAMSGTLGIADKRAALRELVPGRSFAEVGGLWGLHNEMVSDALKADALSAAMIDTTPLTNPGWQQLRERVAAETPRGFTTLQADACAANFAQSVGTFDIVHSPATVFHVHTPPAYLLNLRKITNEYLIITSMTLPEKLSYGGNELDLSGGRFLSTHQLDETQAAVLNAHFAAVGLGKAGIVEKGENLLLPNGMPNFSPWWWLFTAESLRRLLSAVGFDVVSVGESWPGRAHSFLCRPRDFAARAPAAGSPQPETAPARTGGTEEASKRALDFARETFGRNAAWWGEGVASEVGFWRNQLETGGGKWKEAFQRRIGADPPLDGRLESLVRRMGLDAVEILDVGAGPVTSVGRSSPHCRPRVRAVDPLAPLYSRLLAAAGIAPAVETEFAPAEALSYFLPLHSFDVVHCRNALDQAINPLLGILQMLTMLRPGGIVYLRHNANEAEHHGYAGLHQFNFSVEGSRFLIRNPARSVDVGEWLSGIAEIEPWPGGLAAEVLIRPAHGGMVEIDSPQAEMADLSNKIQREMLRERELLDEGIAG
jgi:SAM-dependent methyltransferase